MKYGLTETAVGKIRAVFARFPAIEKAVLYGSRAKGNFKPGSDIDLTLYGEALTSDLCSAIASALDDLLLPYTIDLSVFEELNHAKLREHIERVGVLFYERAQQGASMKKGWLARPLADVCEIRPPKSEARERVSADALVSFAPMEDLGIDSKFLRATQVRPLASVAGSYTYFADGDVLLAKITPCFENGKLGIAAALTNGIGFGSSEFIVFRPSASLDKEFLYYFLARPEFRAEGAERMGGAVGQQRVPKEFVESYPIPVPPLPEQQRIVGILDEAFESIATAKANAETNLQNARALFESHLQSVFAQRGNGWVEKRLVDVSREFGRGKSKHRPRNELKLYDGPYPFIQTGDISNADHWLTEHTQTYSEAGLAQSRLWPKGTICIAIVGATVGETAILDFEACFPDSVIGIVVNEQSADNEYVEFLLQAFKALLKEKGKGTARDNINLGTFENQTFPFPAMRRQKEIVATLNVLREETQRLAHLYERKLAALEALKKSLLHQAFTGEL
jgi:type I restriction enzyme S subunit